MKYIGVRKNQFREGVSFRIAKLTKESLDTWLQPVTSIVRDIYIILCC